DRQWISTRLEHAGKLDQECRARSAVVRADESKRKFFRVVVTANHEAVLACAGNGRYEVDHVNAAGWCLIVPGLFGDRHTDRRQLTFDVGTRLLNGSRTCRPWTEADKLPQMLPCFVGVECRGCCCLKEQREDENCLEHQHQSN